MQGVYVFVCSYLGCGESTGHTLAQAPQSMQAASSIT
jgi:hypothetical protein